MYLLLLFTIFIMFGSVTQSINTNMYVLVHFFKLVLSYLNFTFKLNEEIGKEFFEKIAAFIFF